MDTFFPEWNPEVEAELPVPSQRKPLGVDDELVELIWKNGEVVLLNQTHRKRTYDAHNDDTDSWIHCPIDESFKREFLADLSSENLSPNPFESKKISGQFEDTDSFKCGSSDVNHVFPSSEQPDFAPIPLPPPRFETFDASNRLHNLGDTSKTHDLELPLNRRGCNHQMSSKENCKCSDTAIGSSRCGTEMQSSDNYRRKRKIEDVEETESGSDATESESAARNKPSPKCGRTRRSRVAEVHNLSERKRRDRINEKLRALQELIPYSNKSGKASILDDAIRYLKSLQLQLQLMRMRSGMAQMMLPGMQQHYLSRVGMSIRPPMLPVYQNLMHSSRLPLVDGATSIAPIPNQATINGQVHLFNPVSYHNQMPNPGFHEHYANYIGFQNTSQLTNMFNSASPSIQQNRVLTAQLNNGKERFFGI